MVTLPTVPPPLRVCVACGAPFAGGPKRRSCAPCKLDRQRAMCRRDKQAQTAQRMHHRQEERRRARLAS